MGGETPGFLLALVAPLVAELLVRRLGLKDGLESRAP